MITLKLKYRLKDEQDMPLILDYQRQYSSFVIDNLLRLK